MNMKMKMKINSVKLQLFSHNLFWCSVFFSALAIIACINGNYIGVGFLFVAFVVLRYTYKDKITYHLEKTLDCIRATILLFAISSIPLSVFNSHVSLLAFVPIAICVTYYLYEKQTGINATRKLRKLESEMKKSSIYSMSEEQLRNYGASSGLSILQQDILVLRVKHNYKIVDICTERNYGRTTIKYHLAQIKSKLNLDKI